MIVNHAKEPPDEGFTPLSSSAVVTCVSLEAVPVACEAHPVTAISVIVTVTQGFGVTYTFEASAVEVCTNVGKSVSICAAMSVRVCAVDVLYGTEVKATQLISISITLEATNPALQEIVVIQLYHRGLWSQVKIIVYAP